MRLTIIPVDGIVSVDGVAFAKFDLSQIPETVHAIQWYGAFGEIEHKDLETGKILANEEITNIDDYLFAVDLWNTRNQEDEAFKQSIQTP